MMFLVFKTILVNYKVQTINNPDGTVSIIQIDTGDLQNTQVVTLADGTQAHVVHTVGHVSNANQIVLHGC